MSSDELANAETLPGSGDGPAAGARLAPGTVLRDRYRIVRFLGAGGMGAVYAAHDVTLDHDVALKFVGGARSEVERDRLRAEVRTLQGLTHRGIARTYTYDEADGEPFIVMEVLDGETLAARIARGRLDEPSAREIVRAIAAALDEAHRAGVVHRDVKPANVMLCGGGRVVLMDFGLARADDAPAPDGVPGSVLMTTSLKGTPAYLAPEMALGRRVDARADLYSLGVVAYEAVTGALPFEADSAKGMIDQHVERVADEVRARRPEVSASLSRLIARMMAKEPADRPASAAAVIEALAPRRRRWPLIVAAACIAIVAVIAIVLVSRGDDAPRALEAARIRTVDPTTRARVRAEYDRAEAAHIAGRYTEALDAWRDAYAIVPDPALLYNIASTLYTRGKQTSSAADYRQAAFYYRRYLELAPEAPVEERNQVTRLIDAIEATYPMVDGAPPTDEVRAIYDAALAAFDAGEHRRAFELFLKAYNQAPDTAFLFNTAQAARLAGERDQAVFFYRLALQDATDFSEDQRRIIEQYLAELERGIDAGR